MPNAAMGRLSMTDSFRDGLTSKSRLTLSADDAQVQRAWTSLVVALLEEFPEASPELISDLLLGALDSGAICAGGSATPASDGVARLELGLDTARIAELLASALRAGQGNRVAHGQPLSELIDVEERQSYSAGAGRLIPRQHVPGDTTTSAAPDAVWIGSGDA